MARRLFSTQLMIALTIMASLALAQGVLAGWNANRAEAQVMRGRVAGDLQSGFWELSATKQRLRAWSLRALIGADHLPGDGEMLRQRMAGIVDRLQVLSVEAERMDRQAGVVSTEGSARDETLALLEASVVALRDPIAEINRRGPTRDARTAWAAIESVFDRGAGRDLRELLNQRIETEAQILKQARAAADRSLERVALMTTATAVLLGLTALVLALYFARALRRPLAEMSAVAKAFEQGQLTHRMPTDGYKEFARFGDSINRMAAELLARREQEAGIRAELEVQVAVRTRELEAALGELRQAETRRRQLLGDISHELRTPMTAIRGEAEVALRGATKAADDYREALSRIGQAARQMGTLIEDLLMMARSDAEVLYLDLSDLDANAPLEEALAGASSMARQRDLTLKVEADPAPAPVRGDGQRLQQIMVLLLDNALRYSRPGGEVTVSAGPDPDAEGTWRLRIVDHGVGIPPEDLPRVFERGFRAANARAHRPDGTGLGLSIARALAERQGGGITLESAADTGTAATLRLPLIQAAG